MADTQDVEKVPPTPEPSSPSSPCSPSAEKLALQDSSSAWRGQRLYRAEFAALRCLQRLVPQWLMLPVALFIHHLASEVMILPLVGVLAWTISLPGTASTVTCACFCVSLNFALKWIWQRPRPVWLDNGKASEVWNIGAVWEGDYAFPSGHTHCLSGVLLCAFFTFEMSVRWLPMMLLLGAVTGLSRNYLGMHWCSDTLIGWVIGTLSGLAWGLLDPYGALLRRQDVGLSVAVGAASALGLTILSALGRALSTPVHAEQRAEWLETAVQGLEASKLKRTRIVPDEAEDGPSARRTCGCRCLQSRQRRLRSRHLAYAAGPALCGGMCLALTGAYGQLPPQVLEACLQSHPPFGTLLLRMAVGLTGLLLLFLLVGPPMHMVRDAKLEDRSGKAAAKAALLLLSLTLAPLWVFGTSQLLLEELDLGCQPA
ncbi:unnamed protein product [Effrenium voratum]|uniref:Phosphatidic acid phosphatase type 2/haloperoxidase domain-containing protein n=1 Tax=Effrenium voratum TaxID=2562239 RepID=A0AA36HZR5_9DINO|nr:unnamed protein product [Effrenium voratum]